MSRVESSAQVDSMDCRATAGAVSRNDGENIKSSSDSKILESKTQNIADSQAAGFCDDFVGCQGGGEGIYLSGNEQAPAADSRKSAQNKRSEVSLEKPTPFILRDDSGDNISHLNANFCELTAMYWAWKNVDSSYYGLFHYRRVLDFSGKIKGKKRFDVNRKSITAKKIAKTFKLDRASILKQLEKSPIVLASPMIVPHGFEVSPAMSQYDIYARDHRKRDLDIVIDIIRAKFPHLVESMEDILFTPGVQLSWCNMFVMRKDLYQEYCEFLFSTLLEAQARIDLSGYNAYQSRIYGFISERLLNIFVRYKSFSAGIAPIYKNHFELREPKPLFGTQITGDTKRIYAFGLRVHKSKLQKS
ncbi:DUF4422 domain-containing protein [Helicobacter canis]|uniref:DUF4422 domain-containing protein n=1 Tax=Helicobacter canis NCTC 12740 TaxID=1357399 RepID=V8CK79_9HELI|nr:DUF4422 domain-containing protein [Helicobacter canis]ETD27769.1 hypothetical protein HMPREF2087_00690 [Helicobacter canis NCTC 12740]